MVAAGVVAAGAAAAAADGDDLCRGGRRRRRGLVVAGVADQHPDAERRQQAQQPGEEGQAAARRRTLGHGRGDGRAGGVGGAPRGGQDVAERDTRLRAPRAALQAVALVAGQRGPAARARLPLGSERRGVDVLCGGHVLLQHGRGAEKLSFAPFGLPMKKTVNWVGLAPAGGRTSRIPRAAATTVAPLRATPKIVRRFWSHLRAIDDACPWRRRCRCRTRRATPEMATLGGRAGTLPFAAPTRACTLAGLPAAVIWLLTQKASSPLASSAIEHERVLEAGDVVAVQRLAVGVGHGDRHG